MRVDQAVQQITADTGRTPRVEAIAEYLELSVEDVLAGLEARTAHYSISLDTPGGEESEETTALGESLGGPDDGFGMVETRLWLSSGVQRLPHLERQALCLRIERGLKQREIAEVMGCSQMQISRLLRRAARHLREQAEPQPDKR
jgi:RNA polymerase sigma-B factor